MLFATPNDGMVVEQSGSGIQKLYVTHDGAKKWVRWALPRGAAIMDLATSSAGFFATERTCLVKPYRCADTSVLSASPTAERWTAHPIPRDHDVVGDIVDIAAWGNRVWLTGSTTTKPYAFLDYSTDGGQTFAEHAELNLLSLNACGLQATSATTLWAQCRGGMALSFLHSSDAGTTWTAIHTPGIFMGSSGGVLEPISPSSAYLDMGLGTHRFYFVSDNGGSVVPLGSIPLQEFSSLIFINLKHGLAVGERSQGSRFITMNTTDGGRNWSMGR
ncbi:MAG TPA: hypothetical protein VND83_04780 [Acidimicrobiales bacterium]|nr:hypothetical protein [Acidimicrobiales bacterium]